MIRGGDHHRVHVRALQEFAEIRGAETILHPVQAKPIMPTPIRLPGATVPSAPRAEAGRTAGAAQAAPTAAPEDAKNRRREYRPPAPHP